MKFLGKKHFDYLITVGPIAEKHTPVFPGVTDRLHWLMAYPAKVKDSDDKKKEMARQALNVKISAWLKEPPSSAQSTIAD